MRNRILAILACLACVGWATPANAADADVVTFWNQVTTGAIGARGPGAAGLLDLAKVHVAMHDAVQAYEHRFEPYCATISDASGSPVAAAATAARDVLVALFPSNDTIEPTYLTYLDDHELTDDPGIDVGHLAATCLLELRSDDGSWPVPAPTFLGGTGAGEWRPTPPNSSTTSMTTPWLGDVTPFALTSVTQLRIPGPPKLTSNVYRRDYDEVKALGSNIVTSRTLAQEDLARFYSDNFTALWQRTLRAIAMEHVEDIGDRARLFALANIAAADAGIAAWYTKVFWNFWRPITAIREGENDGNPETRGDPTWTPRNTTPNYPDYTSGANNLTSSIARILHRFFGTDRMTFTVESRLNPLSPEFRTYDRFSDICKDVIDVRIYQGIHFRFADVWAFRQGREAANWAFDHVLRPVEEEDSSE